MQIQFTHGFVKQYKKQSVKVRRQFDSRLAMFMIHPTADLLKNHALAGKYQGYRSINVNGDIRALYKEQNGIIIIFAFIGSHSQLYG
jgi:addiction module RelE/StbE family toxin